MHHHQQHSGLVCKVSVCLLVLLIALHTTQAVSVDCPNIRHADVSKHRFRTCMKNIQGILNFMCSFRSFDMEISVRHVRHLTRSEVQHHVFCECCTQRCSQRRLLQFC